MNKVILMGRLTRDPEVRYSQGGNSTCVARYTLAVSRPFKNSNGEQEADFISCVAFGKAGEFAEKYLTKGTMIGVTGRIQTGNYTDKDGKKVYTTDVVIATQEFCEKKGNGENSSAPSANDKTNNNKDKKNDDGFMNIPEDADDELPFN